MNLHNALIAKVQHTYYAVFVNNKIYSDSGSYFVFDDKSSAKSAIKLLRENCELDELYPNNNAEVKEIVFSPTKKRNSTFCYLILGKEENKNKYFIFYDETCNTDTIACFNTDIEDSYICDEVASDVGIITTAYIVKK